MHAMREERHECLGYERRRVFIRGLSKTSHTLAHRPRDLPAEQLSTDLFGAKVWPDLLFATVIFQIYEVCLMAIFKHDMLTCNQVGQ